MSIMDKFGIINLTVGGAIAGGIGGAFYDDSSTARGSLSGGLAGLSLGGTKMAAEILYNTRKDIMGNPLVSGKGFSERFKNNSILKAEQEIATHGIRDISNESRKKIINSQIRKDRMQTAVLGGVGIAGIVNTGLSLNQFTKPVNER